MDHAQRDAGVPISQAREETSDCTHGLAIGSNTYGTPCTYRGLAAAVCTAAARCNKSSTFLSTQGGHANTRIGKALRRMRYMIVRENKQNTCMGW